MNIETRFIGEMQTAGIRIVIVQDGLVMLQADTYSRATRDRRESETRCLSSMKYARDRDSTFSNRNQSFHIDTDRPFTVAMYRHRTARSKAFWHTETLNGRTRMGNAMDRSPPGPRQVSDSFPFPQQVQDGSLSGQTRKGAESYDLCHEILESEGWSLCGQLPQKADKPAGHYKLRLSPSLSTSRDDLTFQSFYRDIRRPRLEVLTPEAKYSARSNASPKRARSVSSEQDLLQDRSSCGSISPVSQGISSMTLRPLASPWESSDEEPTNERCNSVPLMDLPSPRILHAFKRGIDEMSIPSSSIPRSCTSSMIHKKEDERSPAKRQCLTGPDSSHTAEEVGEPETITKHLLPGFSSDATKMQD